MKTISINGSPYQVGLRIGEFGHDAWHEKLKPTSLWQTISTMKNSLPLRTMREKVIQYFPLIWQEITGMACGLNADINEVFAWNCRGDLVTSTSDGCTTVSGSVSRGIHIIAHNEDGFPQLRGDCALLHITPDDGMAFSSFAYPGSLCGHTFSVNKAGIVNTVNNIRAKYRPAAIPRQILARAALNASTLEEAIAILTTYPRSGAFHHTLGQKANEHLYSVEATGSGYSVLELTTVAGHANHLTHNSLAAVEQVITNSSAARQSCLNHWLEIQCHAPFSVEAARAMLFDQSNPVLPVHRLAQDDPDDENTLATAIFVISTEQVAWEIYELNPLSAEHKGIVH